MAGSHEAFGFPENTDSKVWRYMDFTKFVAMLETNSLYFCRADRLGDPFEGSYSRANEKLRPEVYKGKIPIEKLEEIARVFRMMPQWTFISSWHMNERESAAMWRLYTQSNESIAVQSTFAVLRDSLPKDVFVGMVKYIDYDTEWVPEGNAFYPFLHKRMSFEHEKEVRAVLMRWPPAQEGKAHFDTPSSELGVNVPVDLSQLIQRILVAPNVPSWFESLVAGVTQRYGLRSGVGRSRLEDAPFF